MPRAYLIRTAAEPVEHFDSVRPLAVRLHELRDGRAVTCRTERVPLIRAAGHQVDFPAMAVRLLASDELIAWAVIGAPPLPGEVQAVILTNALLGQAPCREVA